MKRLWLCLTLLLWIPGISYAQGFNLGKGVGSSIGQATLGLTNGSKAVSSITLTETTPTPTPTSSPSPSPTPTSTVENYSLSGKVTDKKNNKPLQGVLITIAGDSSGTTTTNKKGKYIFSSLDSGDYTITPTLEGYTFTPKSRNVTIATRNKKKIDFKGRKLLKTSHGGNDVPIPSLSVLVAPTAETGWPYGDPDADGYYTINGYKMRLYDASDNVITDMPTSYASVVKIEVKVEESYAGGSVNGSLFADTSFSAGGPSYPLVFNGTLVLTMDSDEFGTLSGTVEILDCTLDSGATFFSSGSMDVNTEGSLTTGGFDVTHSTSGTLNVSGSTFQGALSLTYNVTGAPIPVSATVDMTMTINADGSGSYSTNDSNVGSGTF